MLLKLTGFYGNYGRLAGILEAQIEALPLTAEQASAASSDLLLQGVQLTNSGIRSVTKALSRFIGKKPDGAVDISEEAVSARQMDSDRRATLDQMESYLVNEVRLR